MESRDVVTCGYHPVKGVRTAVPRVAPEGTGAGGAHEAFLCKHFAQDRENAGLFMPHWEGLVVTRETKLALIISLTSPLPAVSQRFHYYINTDFKS